MALLEGTTCDSQEPASPFSPRIKSSLSRGQILVGSRLESHGSWVAYCRDTKAVALDDVEGATARMCQTFWVSPQ